MCIWNGNDGKIVALVTHGHGGNIIVSSGHSKDKRNATPLSINNFSEFVSKCI